MEWKEAKDEVEVLVKDKGAGGLNLPDLRSMTMVANVKWLNKIVTKEKGSCWSSLCTLLTKSGIKDYKNFHAS